MPCYRIYYQKEIGTPVVDVLRCVSFAAFQASGSTDPTPGRLGGPWLDCPDLGWNSGSAWVRVGSVTLLRQDCTDCNRNATANDTAGITDSAYDCVNGGCVGRSTYNTPGKYTTLAACQSGCAKDSNCTGECVSAAELTELNQAIGKLKTKYCG